MEPTPEARPITGFIGFSNPDCDRASLGFEAVISHADDGSPVTDLECLFTFDDGATSTDCAGTHEFALTSAGEVRGVTLLARDVSSGAEVRLADQFFVYREMYLDATAVAPACGLEISTGMAYFAPINFRLTTVSPPENVVSVDSSGSRFQVSAPGTYTVTTRIEQERPFGPICTAEEVNIVEVVACPDDDDDHEHVPGCSH